LDQSIHTYGQVVFDETRIQHVHTKFEGFIEMMQADFVGQQIRAGDPLFTIYSPDLYATENEYLLALRAREEMSLLREDPNFKTGGIDLVGAARQRLALWDIGEKDLAEIEKTRQPIRALTFRSPYSGYVTAKTALHGMKVSPADSLYDIVDLSVVWILADIYEVNLPFVRVGQPAGISFPYLPGRTWQGRIAYISPTVDPSSRTVKARLELPNPNGELKPDMYADIVIGGARGTGIAVPENAVISTGERNIVFVAKGNGIFEPREVVLGVGVRNLYEIKKGVSEGEKVVTGANFLLDSESKLKAAALSSSPEHQRGK
jgi:Cu(I)/Ag(I) efflux system membrane fusion protein